MATLLQRSCVSWESVFLQLFLRGASKLAEDHVSLMSASYLDEQCHCYGLVVPMRCDNCGIKITSHAFSCCVVNTRTKWNSYKLDKYASKQHNVKDFFIAASHAWPTEIKTQQPLNLAGTEKPQLSCLRFHSQLQLSLQKSPLIRTDPIMFEAM